MPLDPALDAWLGDSAVPNTLPSTAMATVASAVAACSEAVAAGATHRLAADASADGTGYTVDPEQLSAPADALRSLGDEIRAATNAMTSQSTCPDIFLYGSTTAEAIASLGREWHDWFTAFAREFDVLAAKIESAAAAYAATEDVNAQRNGRFPP